MQKSLQIKFTVDAKAPVVTKGEDMSTIDKSSLMVLVYDVTNKADGQARFIAELPILKTTTNSDGNVEFLCALDIELPEVPEQAPSYKFVVLTNSTNEQYGLSYGPDWVPNIESLDFPYPFNSGVVPMWGVKTHEIEYGADGEPVELQNLGQIDVLRAAAKVGVKLSDEVKAQGFTIEDLKINYVAGSGYSVPGKWNTVAATDVLAHSDAFRPVTSGTVLADVNAFSTIETTGQKLIYIPEIANDEELAMSITLKKGDEVFEFPYEKGIKFRTYSEGAPTDEKFNVIRNHFYDYTVTAVHTDIELEMIEYETLPWIPEEVEVGGEVKYLVLNTDLVKIYSENVDATTLKFTSSSPIASVVLKDMYSHDVRGENFTMGTDGVTAYYVSKYGQKIQLGEDPGFTMPDKEVALVKEQVILANISADAEQNVLQGGITITSPFMADPENEIAELQGESHYNTIRYLEFEVTNEQGLTDIFRVEQYPPVIVTNIEGFFSYRDDFRIGKEPEHYHYHNPGAFQSEFGKIRPVDNGEPTHYLNPVAPFFTLAIYYPYHLHECSEDGTILSTNCGAYVGFEELVAGLMERDYMKTFEDVSAAPGAFHREHYMTANGQHLISSDPSNKSKYYQNLGPCYYDEATGKYYRRHYTGNSFNTFYQKYVDHVYTEDSLNPANQERLAGQADICSMAPSQVTWDRWEVWGIQSNNINHRMYHIRTSTTSPEYSLGRPKLVDINGNPTTDVERGDTQEGPANARMVSPSFMVASQLGGTNVPANRDHYVVPQAVGMYTFAKRQCREYVETTYEDLNGNMKYDDGEPVTHYHDWRLPTKAEIELIIKLQRNTRAIDQVLNGKTYFCASLNPDSYENEDDILSGEVENWTSDGYYMRCVRDVYED